MKLFTTPPFPISGLNFIKNTYEQAYQHPNHNIVIKNVDRFKKQLISNINDMKAYILRKISY